MKDKKDYIEVLVSGVIYNAFKLLANQKITHENWIGRNTEQKINNFVMCWISEYAFKEILGNNNIKYAYFGLYVGPVDLSPKADFILWNKERTISVGIRSRTEEQLLKYNEVSYPDDRLKVESEIISDHIIICSIDVKQNNDVLVKFYGGMNKNSFLSHYDSAKIKFSPSNQENFRLISLDCFKYKSLLKLLEESEKNNLR